MFFVITESDVCNYADDTTLYTCDVSLEILMTRLEHDANEVIRWFEYNYMKLNEDKCHLLVSGHKYELMFSNIGDSRIYESNNERLLGIDFYSSLIFDEYMKTVYNKAGNKLNVISRQCKLLSFSKRRLILNSFFHSQFAYCPLLWMFHSRGLNYKINQLHFRALRVIYRDDNSSFDELLKRDKSFTVHQRNVQFLAIEMYKLLQWLISFVYGENISN